MILYALVTKPLATTLAMIGISVLLYMLTRSEVIVLGFVVASLFIRDLNRLFIPKAPEPVGVEAFQARDAPSVHTRIQEVKLPVPLSPKVENITGVLESPEILDNSPLQAMGSLAAEGVPGASIPASAKARVLIYPPAEGFQDAPNMSIDRNPMQNPYLQNGEDEDALNASLIRKGTDMSEPNVPSSDMTGATTNAPA